MNNFPDYRLEHQVLMKLFKKEKKFIKFIKTTKAAVRLPLVSLIVEIINLLTAHPDFAIDSYGKETETNSFFTT